MGELSINMSKLTKLGIKAGWQAIRVGCTCKGQRYQEGAGILSGRGKDKRADIQVSTGTGSKWHMKNEIKASHFAQCRTTMSDQLLRSRVKNEIGRTESNNGNNQSKIYLVTYSR